MSKTSTAFPFFRSCFYLTYPTIFELIVNNPVLVTICLFCDSILSSIQFLFPFVSNVLLPYPKIQFSYVRIFSLNQYFTNVEAEHHHFESAWPCHTLLCRLAFSCLWKMTPQAEVVSTEFTKSIICSRVSLFKIPLTSAYIPGAYTTS